MELLKKILKSDSMKAVIGWIAAAYIWLVYKTGRWQVLNAEAAQDYIQNSKPFILAFWHGRLLLMPTLMEKNVKAHVLISHHGDGEIIARAIRHWRLDSIRGSSSKGALPAIKEILKVIRRNEIAVITPDGPRGPRMRVQDGVMRIAAMSGVPVIPASFSASGGKRLSSWDHFLVARPFSKGVIIWGDPVHVPRSDKDNAHAIARREIEESLITITQKADRLCGHIPVEPASQEKNHKVA
ncbi:MAG: lysophospholipid acyltransferase family protein [Sneathiella sp.]